MSHLKEIKNNHLKLRERLASEYSKSVLSSLEKKGLGKMDLCLETGLTTTAIYNKLKGITEWTGTEIVLINNLLGVEFPKK
jgi:hypothetical protein